MILLLTRDISERLRDEEVLYNKAIYKSTLIYFTVPYLKIYPNAFGEFFY